MAGIDISGGIRWRYEKYVEPYLLRHGEPLFAIRRFVQNRRLLREKRPTAFVYANPWNVGDFASHCGLQQLVGLEGVELFCDEAALPSTFGVLSGPSGSRREWRAIFVGGGGLLHDYFDPFWRGILKLDLPLVLFGVGINCLEPMRKNTDPELLRQIARRAIGIHVRDEFTKEILCDHDAEDVTVGLCPSVDYISQQAASIPRSRTHLLHVIHPGDLTMAGTDVDEIRGVVRARARELGLVYDETNHMGRLTHRLLRRYARSSVVVSSRLHGCIFSFAMQIPFVGIECDRKLGSFLTTHVQGSEPLNPRQLSSTLSAEFLRQRMSHAECGPTAAALQVNRDRMSGILDQIGRGEEA